MLYSALDFYVTIVEESGEKTSILNQKTLMCFKDTNTSFSSQKVKVSYYDMNSFNMMIKWSLTLVSNV